MSELTSSERTKVMAARELIREKRYSEALTLLEGINHPAADEWRSKLEQAIAHQPPKKQLRQLIVDDPPFPVPPKKTKRHFNRLLLLILVLVLIFTVIGAIRLQQQHINQLISQRYEAARVLNMFCVLRLARMDSISCDQWVSRLLNDDMSLSEDILFCDSIYNRDGEIYSSDSYAERFISCLADHRIYLPN